MILLLDNYDSFVFNLARYVAKLGHSYQVVRSDQISISEIAKIKPSHIILSPGPCTPNEAGVSLECIQEFASCIPMLGVCLGHQALAQAFGGEIIKAECPMHGKPAAITHNQTGVLADLPTPMNVARYHSLIVNKNNFPEELTVTAWSKEQEIMALQHKSLPLYGVQFHPESILTATGQKIVENFFNIT